MHSNKDGVLLINLGTPDEPTVKAIRRYLREFLSDPRVVDIPAPARWLLVNGVIAPFRPYKTKQAYEKIWFDEGSPLLYYSRNLQHKLQQSLGDSYLVELGMRYGNPSIEQAVANLADHYCDTVHILPLFPQYSSAATGSAMAKALQAFNSCHNIPKIKLYREFYDDPLFIQSLTETIEQHDASDSEFYLFSFHGLPERQIAQSESAVDCDRQSPCPVPDKGALYCYRAQSYQTARLVASELGLNVDQFDVSFQSRLGRTPWIKPYTDHYLPHLKEKGIDKLTIICPSFTADCLETLEEIGIQARQQWQELGGQQLTLIPCVNDSPTWVDTLRQWITSGNNIEST